MVVHILLKLERIRIFQSCVIVIVVTLLDCPTTNCDTCAYGSERLGKILTRVDICRRLGYSKPPPLPSLQRGYLIITCTDSP